VYLRKRVNLLMAKVTAVQVDYARRLVRERKVSSTELAKQWGVCSRTVVRYLYECDLEGTTEPLLPAPGGRGRENWWMQGESHHHSVLTEAQVRVIWSLQGVMSAEEVVRGLRLPVDKLGGAVKRIWRGVNWRWLTETLSHG